MFVDLWCRPKETVVGHGGGGVCAGEGRSTHPRAVCHRLGLKLNVTN